MRLSAHSLRTLAKILVAVAMSAVLLILVLNAAINPVKVTTAEYSADFTDVSGLRPNGDVRVRGVQVGKVKEIELIRESGQTLARVRFSVEDDTPVTAKTQLAVKYQNLTGIRYIDMTTPVAAAPRVDHLGPANTVPSFDITSLFNGLQPVLNTLSTEEINEISQNAITLLQGDGGGLEPMLDSIQKLADLAVDREQVISTLVENLSRISDSFGGRSDEIIEILRSLEVPIDAAIRVLDEFIQTSILGPQFMRPIASIIRNLGLDPSLDINRMIADAFTTAERFGKALRILPGTLSVASSARVGLAASGAAVCSKGRADLPEDVTMLLNGAEVTICKA
ncbi:MCE family protein [Gordonia terrae]|uniref:MCE family protein n=1 Tax=Gordonia terrae TaxID=2055 RepID=A0A2I1R1F5_9ACTN|nr:MlaD family protein [Gordonia terrae]PKZ62949.1 MCE family protein [Gordonia terrae]